MQIDNTSYNIRNINITPQSLSEYLYENRVVICKACIDYQQITPEYTHENNMDTGIGFEAQICSAAECLRHASQEVDKGTKRDAIYIPVCCQAFDDVSEHKKQFEIKTFKAYLKKTAHKTRWQKKNGNETSEQTKAKSLETIPDGVLCYQKYDEILGIPAILGFVNKERLAHLLEHKLSQTKTDSMVTISINDFEWYHVETQIPIKKPEYKQAMRRLEKEQKARVLREKQELSKQYDSGNFYTCDRHDHILRPASKLSKKEKLLILSELPKYKEQGITPWYIAKEKNVNVDWVYKKYANCV